MSRVSRGYLVVDGQGDVQSAPNLVTRLWSDLELPHLIWPDATRVAGPNNRTRFEKISRFIYGRDGEIDALLVLTDEDDRCPKETAPEIASWLSDLNLPVPAAVVLLHREYETLFLPCLSLMAGRPLKNRQGVLRPGLRSGLEYPSTDYEERRGVKEWLTRQLPLGRSYKETTDQLALTRMLDFDVLRASALPCFGSLERSLLFLAKNLGCPGTVYPRI